MSRPIKSIGSRVRWSVVNSLCGLGASAISYAVIARFVDPAEYGRVAIVLAVWGLCSVPIDWCGPSMMRFGPIELGRGGSLRVTFSTRLVFVIGSLLVVLPSALTYLALARGWPGRLIALTAASMLAAAALSVAQWCAVAAQEFALLAAGNILVRLALPAAIVGQVLRLGAVRAEVMTSAVVMGTALGAVLLLAGMRRRLGLVRPDRELLGGIWRYSLPGLLATPSLAAISYLDPILLARCASHAEVGRYQFAYVTVTAFGMMAVAVNNVLAPELVAASARGDASAVERYRIRSQPRLAIGLGLSAFACGLLCGPIARAILPARYGSAGEVAALLCIAGGFTLGAYSLHPFVTATDSVWPPQVASLISAATNVLLDVLLAPRWGATGIAFANILATATYLVLLALLMRRKMGARLLSLGPLIAGGALAAGLLGAGTPIRVLGALVFVAVAEACRRAVQDDRAATAAPSAGSQGA